MGKLKQDTRPLGSPRSWAQTPGTLIAGQAAIDGADHTAVTMEQKWGAGRLRLLVSTELREKFDRQRYLFNQAIWHGDLEAVRTQSARMAAAWRALDGAAEAARRAPLLDGVWEVVLEDGTVAAITQGATPVLQTDGRKVVVYTLDEIGRLLSHYPAIAQAKQVFPGATVEAVRRPTDPLDDIRDTLGDLDDPLNDPLPTFGA
jgi:hypothetical protein